MTSLPFAAITFAALSFAVSCLRVFGEPPASSVTEQAGMIAREQPVGRIHLEEWLKHARQSQAEVFRIARLGRNQRGGDPWFYPKRSLVFEKGALVALRYFSAFYTGSGDLSEYERRIKEGDPMYLVEYDLRTRSWALIQLPGRQTNALQDGAAQPANAPESKPEGKEKPQPESEGRP